MAQLDSRILAGLSSSDFSDAIRENRDEKERKRLRDIQIKREEQALERDKTENEILKRAQRTEAENSPQAGAAIKNALIEAQTINELISRGRQKEALQVLGSSTMDRLNEQKRDFDEAMQRTGRAGMEMFEAGADITRMKRFGNLLQKDMVGAGVYLRENVIPGLEAAFDKFQKSAEVIPNSAIGQNRAGDRVVTQRQPDGSFTETPVGLAPVDEPETFSTIQLADGRSVQINNRTKQESTSPRTPPPTADGGEGVRGQKINDLMAQTNPQTGQNFTRAEAANRVDNFVRVEQNPAGGAARVIDEVNLTANEVSSGRERMEPPGPAEGQGIFSQIRKGTGLMSGISAGVSIAGGQFGLPVNPEVLQARDALSAALNPLIEALQITDRMGSQEVARIGKMGNLDPGLFKSPQAMEAQAIGLDRRLRVDLAQALAEVDNPDLPDRARQAASDDATAIQNFLVKLDVPDNIYASILTIETIPELDINDLRRLRTTITDEELDALPEDVWNAYKARLSRGQ